MSELRAKNSLERYAIWRVGAHWKRDCDENISTNSCPHKIVIIAMSSGKCGTKKDR